MTSSRIAIAVRRFSSGSHPGEEGEVRILSMDRVQVVSSESRSSRLFSILRASAYFFAADGIMGLQNTFAPGNALRSAASASLLMGVRDRSRCLSRVNALIVITAGHPRECLPSRVFRGPSGREVAQALLLVTLPLMRSSWRRCVK